MTSYSYTQKEAYHRINLFGFWGCHIPPLEILSKPHVGWHKRLPGRRGLIARKCLAAGLGCDASNSCGIMSINDGENNLQSLRPVLRHESHGQTLGFWRKIMPLSVENFISMEKTALGVLLGSYRCEEINDHKVTHAHETWSYNNRLILIYNRSNKS